MRALANFSLILARGVPRPDSKALTLASRQQTQMFVSHSAMASVSVAESVEQAEQARAPYDLVGH